MTEENRMNELITLKEIAETLNRSYDMNEMLDAVLMKLVEVTGLTTGWIFLVDEHPEYACVADHQLPPGLMWNDKKPMHTDQCWCLERYWDQELTHAVNIISCKRLSNAVKYKWGDTQGITHHATVPLKAGGELFGILNVGAPGKEIFTKEELALLEAVAFQIGTAVNRTRLYHAQQKRATNFAKLGECSQHLGSVLQFNKIPQEAVLQIGRAYEWSTVAFFIQEELNLSLRAVFQEGKVDITWKSIPIEEADFIGNALAEKRCIVRNKNEIESSTANGLESSIGIARFESAISLPIQFQQHTYGVLVISSPKRNAFDEQDIEVIKAIAETISFTMENARLYEQRRELTRVEERNRLARDLHDSVCQTLFSLSLTAKGAESILSDQSNGSNRNYRHTVDNINSSIEYQNNNNNNVNKALREIQNLSQEALKEMRSLIWQLRPSGLEKGLITALKEYGNSLGLEVISKSKGIQEMPSNIEEGLYRMGQEVLNNVSKHSGTNKAFIHLQITDQSVKARFRDDGVGFHMDNHREKCMGLLSMRERAELLGGSVSIVSEPGKGTEITAFLPNQTVPQIDKGGE